MSRSLAQWWQTALQPSIVRRAAKTSLLIGTVLICINHWEALLSGEVSAGRLLKVGLTYLVPYGVSTGASVAATLAVESMPTVEDT